MHELAIAKEIKEIVLEKVKEHRGSRVTKIVILAGELTSIVPDALTFSLESVAEGTAMEKAKFVIKPVKLKAECKDCGKKYRPELPGMPCGKCGSFNTKITAGKELTVKTIEME